MQALLLRIIAVVLPAHILLSWPLWQSSGRLFPTLPLVELPWAAHPVWTWLHLIVTFALCGLLAIFPTQSKWRISLMVWMLWMAALDMNRMQVWLYFYLLALAVLRLPNDTGGMRWLLAAVYCWGGFYKITPYFTDDNFPWFCAAFNWLEPLGQTPRLGYAVAVGEMLLAPGLLWPVTRPLFRWLAVAFHTFIIAALSPLGHNWNLIVIPWNLAMLLMVWQVFAQKEGIWPDVRKHGIVLAIAWLLPVLNMLHWYPAALSWEMYTNTQDELSLYSDTAAAPWPELDAVWATYAFDDRSKLLLDDWAMDEMRVPMVKFHFLYPVLQNKLCSLAVHPDKTGLLILQVNRWNPARDSLEKRPCKPE